MMNVERSRRDRSSNFQGPGSHPIQVHVLFSETGHTRKFGFQQPPTIAQLRAEIEPHASELLSPCSSARISRFFLDKSGVELDDNFTLSNGADLVIFTHDVKPRALQLNLQPRRTIDVPECTMKFNLPNEESHQLHDYFLVYFWIGGKLELLCQQFKKDVEALDMLSTLLNGLLEASQCLDKRIKMANDKLGNGIQDLDLKITELDQLAKTLNSDLFELGQTPLHQLHQTDGRTTLQDLIPSAELKRSAKNIEILRSTLTTLSNNRQSLMIDLDRSDIENKQDNFSNSHQNLRKLFEDLGAERELWKSRARTLQSCLSRGNATEIRQLLEEKKTSGTAQFLRQNPPNSISETELRNNEIQSTQQHGLQICNSIQEMITDQIDTLSKIRNYQVKIMAQIPTIDIAGARFRTIKKLGSSYEAALREVIRRRDFRASLALTIQECNNKINSRCESEICMRAQFSKEHSASLDAQLFPGFDDKPAASLARISPFDQSLPDITRDQCMNRTWFHFDIGLDSESGQAKQQQQNSNSSSSSNISSICSSNLSIDSQLRKLSIDSVESIPDSPMTILELQNLLNKQKAELEKLNSDFENISKMCKNLESKLSAEQQLSACLAKDKAKVEERMSHESRQWQMTQEMLKREFEQSQRAYFQKLDENRALTRKLEDQNIQLENLKSQIMALQNINDEKTQEIKSLKQQIDDFSVERDDLSSQRDIMESRLVETQIQLNRANNSLTEFRLEIDQARIELKNQSKQLENRQQELKTITAERDQLKQLVATSTKSIESERTRNARLSESLKQSHEDFQQLKSQCDALKSCLENNRTGSTSEESNKAQPELAEISLQLQQLVQQFMQLKQDKATVEAELSETKVELSQAHTSIQNLEIKNSQIIAEFQDLKRTNVTIKGQLEKAIKDREDLRKQITGFIDSVNGLKREITVKEQQFNRASADRQSIQTRVRSLEDEIAAKDRQLNDTGSNLQNQIRQNEVLKRVNARLEEQMAQMESQIQSDPNLINNLLNCAMGIQRIADFLGHVDTVSLMQSIQRSPQSVVLNPQVITTIVEGFTESIGIQENDHVNPNKITIKVADFGSGGRVLFTRRRGERFFMAVCMDPSEPPFFLSEEVPLSEENREAFYLVGEAVYTESKEAEQVNPFNLPAGTRYNVIHATI